jgi:hypothetical protein
MARELLLRALGASHPATCTDIQLASPLTLLVCYQVPPLRSLFFHTLQWKFQKSSGALCARSFAPAAHALFLGQRGPDITHILVRGLRLSP